MAERSNSFPRQGILFCTVGRMNPPTSGHMIVIEHMFRSASAVGGHVVVFLSDTSGREKLTLAQRNSGKIPKENPLPCERKKQMVTKMINRFLALHPDFAVPFEIICGNSVPVLFGYVARTRPKQVVLCLGNEPEKVELWETIRKGFFDDAVPRFTQKDTEEEKREKIQAALAKSESRRQTYGGIVLKPHFIDRPPGSMSATMVRNYVKKGNQATFNTIYEPYLEPENRKALFTNIVNGTRRIEQNDQRNAKIANSKTKTPKTPKTPKTAKTAKTPKGAKSLSNITNKLKAKTNKNRNNTKAASLAKRRT